VQPGLVPIEGGCVRPVSILGVTGQTDRELEPVRRAPLRIETEGVDRSFLESKFEWPLKSRAKGSERQRRDGEEADRSFEAVG
jgi:hypothetical protein